MEGCCRLLSMIMRCPFPIHDYHPVPNYHCTDSGQHWSDVCSPPCCWDDLPIPGRKLMSILVTTTTTMTTAMVMNPHWNDLDTTVVGTLLVTTMRLIVLQQLPFLDSFSWRLDRRPKRRTSLTDFLQTLGDAEVEIDSTWTWSGRTITREWKREMDERERQRWTRVAISLVKTMAMKKTPFWKNEVGHRNLFIIASNLAPPIQSCCHTARVPVSFMIHFATSQPK